MRIDAHQHFWHYDPVKCSWMDDNMGVLKRDYLPEDLKGLLVQNKIDGCVAVQADQSEEETLFLLTQAEKYSFIKGVVGWVDLRSDQVEERLIHFSKYPKLKGVRHIVQAEADGFMLKNEFQRGIALLKKYNLTYDILIYPHQLNEAIKFCEKFPDHKMVIDHLAKPYIKKKTTEPWASQMKDIASNKNVCCKISGMVTEADWQQWENKDFKFYLDTVFEAFGTDGLMYGSDWPVSLLASDYQKALNIVEEYMKGSSEKDKSKVMGLNVIQFYNLK
jgi:L-fuconolactonase